MKYIAIDIETVGLDPFCESPIIWMLSVNDGKKIQVFHDCFGKLDYFKQWKAILEDDGVCKVVHNANFDATYIRALTGIKLKNIWDTMLAEQVIQGVRISKDDPQPLQIKYSSSLAFTLPRYGFPKLDKSVRENFIDRPKGTRFTKDELEYSKGDVKYLLELRKAQDYILTRDHLIETALLENKLVEKTVSMRVHGLGFDLDRCLQMAEVAEKKYNSDKSKLPKTVSNWNSHAQVKSFFKSKGIEIPSYKVIDKVYVKTKNPTLLQFIKVQEQQKTVTTYGRNWLKYIKPDGRVHCDFSQMVDTGRYGSHNPNLQNIKKEGEFRDCFVASTGNLLGLGDFSGQEMAIMAANSQEDLWINALLRGDDIHAITAKALFPEWDDVGVATCTFPKQCTCPNHKKLRGRAKQLNFGLAYGLGTEGFMDKTGLSYFDSSVLIARYKKIIRKTYTWLEKNGRDAVVNGVSYSADPYRRLRKLNVYPSEDWHVKNQGKNTPVQAAGANMLKLSMISIPDSYNIAITVHDEIVLDLAKKEAQKGIAMLKKVMEDSADYITRIKGLVKVKPILAKSMLKVEEI